MTRQTDGVAWLFCPADRPDRYVKAADRADVVILDLEDAVAPVDRPRARSALIEAPLDPARTVVRINPAGTADHLDDLRVLRDTAHDTVMLAKAEHPDDVGALAGWNVVALCETPLGVLQSQRIAELENTVALMWGSEDLAAATGAPSSRDASGRLRDVARFARAHVLLAAAAHGKPAVHTVYVNIADLDGMADEATDAVVSGFAAG